MKRYTELDIIRSLAVIGMVVYHGAYDLQIFQGLDIDVTTGLWKVFERVVAITFLLLVGISFAISWNRTPAEKRRFKFIKRGLIVIGCGMLVSIGTYVIDPATYVRFGVLHLIGVSILLLPLFARLKEKTLMIALPLIVAHAWVPLLRVPSEWFLPLGLMPANFKTVDYFPLIPWFGVVLIGFVLGQFFYVDHLHWRSKLPHLKTESKTLESSLTFPGRYALIIYLLHQPILMAILSFRQQ